MTLVVEQSRLTPDTTLEDLGRIIRACQEHAVAIATPERTYLPDDLAELATLGIQGVLSAAEIRRRKKHKGPSQHRPRHPLRACHTVRTTSVSSGFRPVSGLVVPDRDRATKNATESRRTHLTMLKQDVEPVQNPTREASEPGNA